MATFGNSLLAGLSGMPWRETSSGLPPPDPNSMMAAVSKPATDPSTDPLRMIPGVPIAPSGDIRSALVPTAITPPTVPVDPFAATAATAKTTAGPVAPASPTPQKIAAPAIAPATPRSANPLTDPYSDKFDMMSGRLLTAPAREGVRLGQELWEQQGATKEMAAQSQAEGLQVAAQQQKNAIDQQAAAERARQSEREVYKQAYDSRIAELDAARKDIAASGPSVGKFWDDAGFLGSVAAIVATGLGEYTAIKTGQPNRAGEMLDRAIDRSLKMQMAQLENKKDAAAMQNTILGQMRQKFGDEEAAYGAAKVMMHDLASQKLNEIATRYQGRDAAVIAGSLGKEQELQGKLATNVIAQGAADREVAKQKAAAAAAASEAMRQRKLLEEQNRDTRKSMLAVAEADAKKNGGQVIDLRAPMQIGDQVVQPGTPIVMGADGVPRLPAGEGGTLMVQPVLDVDPTGAKVMGAPVKAKSQKDYETYQGESAKLTAALDNLQRLEELHAKYPNGKFVEGNDAATVKLLQDAVVQNFRTQGRSSDLDQKVMTEAYGVDPLKKELYPMVGADKHSSAIRIENLKRMVAGEMRRLEQTHLKGQPNGLQLGKPK